jgi:hypothetical protein
MITSARTASAEPSDGRRARSQELPEIGIEMTALDRDQLLRLERALIGSERQIGPGNRVVEGYDHEERRERHATSPDAGFVHTRGPRGPRRHSVVYREISITGRVFDTVLAYRTEEHAPAVLTFVEACKGLRA